MRLYEITKNLVPMYYVVDRKSRKLLDFYGYYDNTPPTDHAGWLARHDIRKKVNDAARKEIKQDYPNGTVEIHYNHSEPGELKIGDKIDIKGNKILGKRPEGKNFLEMALDLLREFAAQKLQIDLESAGDSLDVYHEDFKTSTGIPVYFIQDDLKFFYMGILPGNKTTSIIEIDSSGTGIVETSEPVNGIIYLIEFNDGRKINKNQIPTLYKMQETDRYDRTKWSMVAQNNNFETLLGIMLDILWGRIGKR